MTPPDSAVSPALEVTRSQLVEDLRALGVRAGMSLVVHASLRSLGRVAGGAVTVVQALQEVVTSEGLLVMPTFNHGAPYAEGGPGYFDPTATPSESGAISEAFWRSPHVARSLHPTHSFAAWGRGAARLLEGHEWAGTLGADSPLGRLMAVGGFMLHLGTSHRASSVKHLAELERRAPCLEEGRDSFEVRVPGAAPQLFPSWRYRADPCPLTETGELIAEALAKRGSERVGRVGKARASLVSLAECFDVVVELLDQGSGSIPPCARCPIRPSARREGDWT